MLGDHAEAPAAAQILFRWDPRFPTIRQLSQSISGEIIVSFEPCASAATCMTSNRGKWWLPSVAQKFYLSFPFSSPQEGREAATVFFNSFRIWKWKGGYTTLLLASYSELMCCGHARALWEDQESIRRIGGQARPRGPEPRTVCGRPPRCVSQVMSKGDPKWNANAGHISQGSLIGTQLLWGPSIPRSGSQKQRNQRVTVIRSSFSQSLSARPEMAGRDVESGAKCKNEIDTDIAFNTICTVCCLPQRNRNIHHFFLDLLSFSEIMDLS